MSAYDVQAVEAKWRKHWEEHGTFRVAGPGEPGFDESRPKFFALDMFPYPSGKGLHVGHPLGYIATDIVARYKRMRGFNTLLTMGFDAFGLPAEQYALEHNVHPRVTTERNIRTMKRQLKQLSLGYDWDRSFATTDPSYYRWTQWIFLQLYDAWFDPRIEGARPIEELLRGLESGALLVGPNLEVFEAGPEGRVWEDLSEADRTAVVDGQRLAYMAEVPVNWCPMLGTVLANEEVTSEGRSERGDFPVYRRGLKQWMLRITAYADRLVDDLDLVDWPEAVKAMQRNWIGRSHGARVRFDVVDTEASIEVFTTRPDTLFGATYMVLAPEHPLVERITAEERLDAVLEYREEAVRKTAVDRQAEAGRKTGVFTGARARNPVTEEAIPIWIADYVLMGYGTGAIMAVPGHDQRDLEFARAFELAVRTVVTPDDGWLREHAEEASGVDAASEIDALRRHHRERPEEWPEAFVGEGINVQSTGPRVSIDGLPTPKAKQRITEWLAESEYGRAEVQYKLRDWLFSRQRYWGEPFPILHGPDGAIRPVDEEDLPVTLPPMDDFQPERSEDPDAPPRPPLGRAPKSWREVEIEGAVWTRELNTMPNWAGSCWYYLRYLDPDNEESMVGPEKERYWMDENGVDLYVGGVEHAVLHLLYARFWHKVLFDLGHVSSKEPFGRLFNQGYIQAYAYRDRRGVYVPADEVEQRGGEFFYGDEPVEREYGKMGKSLKNMVTPDEVIAEHGCDTFRMYEMYMGPLDKSKPWNTDDIVGIRRFLDRVWRNLIDEEGAARVSDAEPSDEDLRMLHLTIARVTEDMDQMAFNTAIAALIEFNNAWVSREEIPRAVAEPFVQMLAPLAPHVAEELWERIGGRPSVLDHGWPAVEQRYLKREEVELALQVDGKVRGRITVPVDAPREEVERLALEDDGVLRHVEGATVRKVIVVPGRLVNIVTG